MKPRLLKWVVCPSCSAGLRISQSVRRSGEELLEGTLECEHEHQFPVCGGVPRLLSQLSPVERRTKDVYGYEWTRFQNYHVPNFRTQIIPQPAGWFSGKLGLDLGCGAGRHLFDAAGLGAEMIGVDLSDAVDVAYQKVANVPNAHILQSGADSLPFRQGTFDFLYCWGVLHVVADPKATFLKLVPYLKPGGRIVIGIYQVTLRKRLLEVPRALVVHFPIPFARVAAWSAAVLDYYGLVLPARWIACIIGPRLAPRILPSHVREYAKYPFQVTEADWFDRLTAPVTHWYTREQVEGWFQRANLVEITVNAIEDFWWRGEGQKSLS